MRSLHALLLAAALTLLAGCSTVGTVLFGNELTFSELQLQQALDRRFPREYRHLGGLVSMTLLNPRLSMPARDGRLRVDFDVGVAGPGGDSRTPAGRFALTSALRYDPATRGLHLAEPSIERVEIPALGGVMNDAARGALNRWLVDYARAEPIYRLDDSLLGRIGSRRITDTRIEPGRVVVHLGN